MLSPTRQFAMSSLLTITGSTLVLGFVLTYFVEQGMLDREWASTAALLRAAATTHLQSADFPGPGRTPSPEAADRFEDLARQVRMLPEILRVVAYDREGTVLWTDAERSSSRHGLTLPLRRALAGEIGASLEGEAPRGQERVEVYVPITFPGEGRLAGVLETYVDASRVLAGVRRARLFLWGLALASGAVLYAALYGVVGRASRALHIQHAALAQRAEDLQRTNAELRTVQAQLVTAERFAAMGEITAAVAHGLGNPLASIRAAAQVALLDAPSNGPLRERLLQVVGETDRLRDRMRALLDFARPVEQRRVPTALDDAVRHATEAIRERCASQGVTLRLRVPADLPKVRLDLARFEEAFLCLAGNALDAMPGGGVLTITGALAGGDDAGRAVLLTVADTGPGMSPAVIARAFEPFFTQKPGGTGLGLAVARKLLDGSEARLRLESDARGTRAVALLPRDDA